MGLVGRMPMLTHVNRFGRSNEQLGGARIRIDMEDTNFRRIVSQIRQNFIPFSVIQFLENWLVRR